MGEGDDLAKDNALSYRRPNYRDSQCLLREIPRWPSPRHALNQESPPTDQEDCDMLSEGMFETAQI